MISASIALPTRQTREGAALRPSLPLPLRDRRVAHLSFHLCQPPFAAREAPKKVPGALLADLHRFQFGRAGVEARDRFGTDITDLHGG